ncbi:hypothetical protein [Anaeromyxobacter sp. Fw109-5]|uniref:hypothetical protein n=1 Tax=Anaeromyxobacter sp. (strain Fw109-5) TaxID=404589 RepID=UPI0000ED8AFA|nr:hypothetical protein [Anaeromyxobacter sp. Fw109-5]ABS27259.1 conserved hypothetical protein [Anaeromyxobacter sp. Fw109-5]
MLAPVLARLSLLSELSRVRVDCAGRLFLLEAAPGVDAAAALEAARTVLGTGARPLTVASQLEALTRGELWFSAEDVRALSYLEARVLAARVCDRVIPEVALGVAEADRLEDAAVAELRATLDRVHDEGGRTSSAWFDPAWPGIAEGIAARVKDALGEAAFQELRRALLRARG